MNCLYGNQQAVFKLTIITNLRNLIPIIIYFIFFYWLKIGKIGNYCQFSIGDAFYFNVSSTNFSTRILLK